MDSFFEDVFSMLINYLFKAVFGQQFGISRLVKDCLQDFLVGMTVID